LDAETDRLRSENFADRALKPGAPAPDFILPDAQGNPVRLHGLLRSGPVVVVFYRGGWCPHCNIHLRGFQRALPDLRKLSAQVVAISPQLPDESLTTQQKAELEYSVLSDVGNKVGHKFGVVFRLSDPHLELLADFDSPLEASNGKEGAFEMPMPATFVIDTAGIIRSADVEVDYMRRVDPDDVVEKIRQLKR
jgi:peroxiredoxin